MADREYRIKDYIRPINEFPRTDHTEKLGTVLQLVNNCFEPIFVFNKKDDLIGMISIYETLYHKPHPYMTKAEHCMIGPPEIQEEDTIYKVLEVMRDTKLYTLPVYNEKKELIGAIFIKDILKDMVSDYVVREFIAQRIRIQQPVLKPMGVSVKDTIKIFEDGRVSRIVLIDSEGQAKGIVTRKDIAHAYLKPTPKQRFSHRGSSGMMAYDQEKVYRGDDPVSKYASDSVYAESSDLNVRTVIQNLAESDYHSVILVDVLEKPVGYLTLYDIIYTLTNLDKPIEVPIVFKKPSESVSEQELERAEDILYKFLEKFSKRQNILKIEVSFKEPKYANGDTAEFNTTLAVDTSRKSFVAHTAQKEFLSSIYTVVSEIEKQEERLPKGNNRKNEDTKRQLLSLLSS